MTSNDYETSPANPEPSPEIKASVTATATIEKDPVVINFSGLLQTIFPVIIAYCPNILRFTASDVRHFLITLAALFTYNSGKTIAAITVKLIENISIKTTELLGHEVNKTPSKRKPPVGRNLEAEYGRTSS